MHKYKHTIYGVLFAGAIIVLTLSDKAGELFEGFITAPIGSLLTNLMPLYTPIAIIGFPLMYVIYRIVRNENEELKKKIDFHVTRWNNFTKEEECTTTKK